MSESEAGTAAVSKVVYSSGWSALVILAFGQLALRSAGSLRKAAPPLTSGKVLDILS